MSKFELIKSFQRVVAKVTSKLMHFNKREIHYHASCSSRAVSKFELIKSFQRVVAKVTSKHTHFNKRELNYNASCSSRAAGDTCVIQSTDVNNRAPGTAAKRTTT